MLTMKLGEVLLGEKPGVAIALQEAVPPESIVAVCPDAIVELRFDGLIDQSATACAAFAASYGAFPRLGTIRHKDEGGGWKGSEVERLACFHAILPLVDAVDIEVEVGAVTAEVVAAAHEAGKIVIGSFHNFESTPESERLEVVHAAGRRLGVDIVKVAARCNSPEDARRLAVFTLAHRHEQVIVVGMGPYGMASRIFFPALGSLLTYTFLGEPTAPGQLNCVDTLKYLNDFYPQGVASARG